MEHNTSGKGNASEIPTEIKGWNWGALLFNWIWGIGNNTYRAFWVFFPFVGFFMVIALGIKGNEWAWRHKKWESIEQFKATQRKWTNAALLLIAVVILLTIVAVFFVTKLIKNSEVYKTSLTQVSNSQEVIKRIGTPIESGFPQGSINSTGPSGAANLSYNIEGPIADATVVVEATKRLNSWTIDCLVVQYDGTGDQTILTPCE